ncbi:MAG: hypothetical protein JSS86_20270 [Cyanobacteria bacterium SZAS LIN-2]|nr:hypothetical protein [Cyanobacteria bacterium SZAS LIN-3]MBS1998676.1 hypothetical protein [Cyanobacteria bacterium SZAS LIN-2]
MSEEKKLNCSQAKEQLDNLIDCMVEARLQKSASGESFEPQGALASHLSDCGDCHNYHLANQVIIEAAKALPRLDGGEDLTQSIMAMIEIEQEQQSQAVTAAPSIFAAHSNIFLALSFMAFTLITSGVLSDSPWLVNPSASSDWLWSAASWGLALLAVALLRPLIESGRGVSSGNRSVAKA